MFNYQYGYMPNQNPNYNWNTNQYSNNYQQPAQTSTNKIYVNGIDDARNRVFPANSDYMMLDNDKPLLYQKVVDNKGQFEVKAFKITPYSPDSEPKHDNSIDLSSYAKIDDLKPLESEIKALRESFDNLKNNGGV